MTSYMDDKRLTKNVLYKFKLIYINESYMHQERLIGYTKQQQGEESPQVLIVESAELARETNSMLVS
jgi:hypothetical protein